MSPHLEHLQWPFFEARHTPWTQALDAWSAEQLGPAHGADVDAQCRRLVRSLGAAGWLAPAVAGRQYGGAADTIETRSVCLARVEGRDVTLAVMGCPRMGPTGDVGVHANGPGVLYGAIRGGGAFECDAMGQVLRSMRVDPWRGPGIRRWKRRPSPGPPRWR